MNLDSLLSRIISLSTLIHQNLAGFQWGSSWKIQKHICNDLELDDMHASLPGLKCRPFLWCSIVILCLCLLSKAFLVFLIHRLNYLMPILHLNINAVPILSCLRRLLLSLFIKIDHAPKCGIPALSWRV